MGAIDLSFSQSLLFSPSSSNSTSSTLRSVSFFPPGNKSRCLPPLRSMSHVDEEAASKEAKLWGGRFEESVTEIVEKFTESISFDKLLYKQDIRGSKAHATMLAHQGLMTDSEKDSILKGLDDIERQIEADKFKWRTDREDVHMNIEAALTDLIGEPAKKLHTARRKIHRNSRRIHDRNTKKIRFRYRVSKRKGAEVKDRRFKEVSRSSVPFDPCDQGKGVVMALCLDSHLAGKSE